MAARQNYGFERRRKDQMRRAKQEEKRARKTDREATGETGPEMGEAQAVATPTGWEWFSPSRARTVVTAVNGRPDPDGVDDWILLTETPDTEAAP
jgi:hypothetical protein